jgi:BON domain
MRRLGVSSPGEKERRMVFKKRTFFGGDPERLPAEDPAELERRVAHCLAVAPGLDAIEVTVTGWGSTILLAGTVATEEEIARAEEAARSVEGVAEVVNRIELAKVGRG